MSSLKYLRSSALEAQHSPADALRDLAASVLRSGSVLLAVLYRRVARSATTPSPAHQQPVLEFYAESGAPEGALYVNGKLVGFVPGITRL